MISTFGPAWMIASFIFDIFVLCAKKSSVANGICGYIIDFAVISDISRA